MLSRRKFIAASGATLALSLVSPKKASAQSLRLRRDLTKMAPDDRFFQQYSEAITRMHQLPESDPRSWRNQAIIHANFCPHGTLDFLHWHRHYITFFEQICGQLIGEPNFALAYWNWSNEQGRIPEPFFTDGPLNVEFWNDPSDYNSSDWGPIETVGIRGLTQTIGLQDLRGGDVFTEDEIEQIRRNSNFNLFSEELEGTPHNIGHVLLGATNSSPPFGHMYSGLSPLDPVFWLHHCNVDRIWAEWQAAGNTTPSNSDEYNQQFVNAEGDLVRVTANDTRDFTALGFTYETTLSDLRSPVVLTLGNTGLDTPTPVLSEFLASADVGLRELGKADNTEVSNIDLATSIPVQADHLLTNLFGSHAFKTTSFLSTPRIAVEGDRILAVLKNITPPSPTDDAIVVKIFVNCPYLSATTPSDDPHYAGSFSFFGQNKQGMAKLEFVIDITKPLRYLAEKGRLVDNHVDIQLMPLAVVAEGRKQASFKVETIEIIRV
ncbi:MAG: tyrosinase family protein [Symploca sp. SIO2G7]|nr:tyrosinase family protein [Symploca sp. SIO2G7]